MTDDVIQIADIKNDNRLITPIETLRDVIRRIEAGTVRPDKLVVLALQTTDEDGNEHMYKTNISVCNMMVSEVVALLATAMADYTGTLRGEDE